MTILWDGEEFYETQARVGTDLLCGWLEVGPHGGKVTQSETVLGWNEMEDEQQ